MPIGPPVASVFVPGAAAAGAVEDVLVEFKFTVHVFVRLNEQTLPLGPVVPITPVPSPVDPETNRYVRVVPLVFVMLYVLAIR